MEIASNVAQAIASGVMVSMLALSLVSFTALFSLLISAFADWIMGSV